jgi:hypothetical protein
VLAAIIIRVIIALMLEAASTSETPLFHLYHPETAEF